mgnify:CR=1 FL=1
MKRTGLQGPSSSFFLFNTMHTGMKKNLFLSLAVYLATASLNAPAQPADSLINSRTRLFYSYLPVVNPWSQGNNPAGNIFYKPNSISRISTGYDISHDNNRGAQAPGKTGKYHIGTEGIKRIGRFVFNGSIGYNNLQYNDLLYNNTMSFDNRNLYTIGDTVPGKQKQEGFHMWTGIAFPLGKNLVGGFGARYENSLSGKMKDPRNLNRISSLEITPGLIYRWGNLSVGISGGPIWENNELTVSVMENAKHNLFQFLGMGYFEAIRNIYSYSARYDKSGYQADLQVYLEKPAWSFFSNAGYAGTTEELREGTSYRLLDGITHIQNIHYTGNLLIDREKVKHLIGARVNYEKIKGTEVEQHSVTINDGYVSWYSIVTDRWVDDKHIVSDYAGSLSYALLGMGQNRPVNYKLSARVSGNYYTSKHYPVESYGYYEVFSLTGLLEYQHFLSINKLNLDPLIGLGLRHSLSDAIEYQVEEKFFAAVPETDFMNLAADYYTGHASLQLSGRLSGLFREWFVDAGGAYYYFPDLPARSNFNLSFHLSAGIVF